MAWRWERVRRANWTPTAYLCVYRREDGAVGGWSYLFDRPTQEAIGESTPQPILCGFNPNEGEWVLWEGPLDEADMKGREGR
jgi:hypothetical protein